jgi:hypothetical protein
MADRYSPIDPAIAKRVIDRRWPGSMLARNTIRDEEFVAAQLRLAAAGITHDEEIVRLYLEATGASCICEGRGGKTGLFGNAGTKPGRCAVCGGDIEEES